MKRLLVVLTAGLMLLAPASALAFNSGGNPGAVGPNHIEWTGQGATNGALNTVNCRDSGGDAYLLWVLTTDGGSASAATLHLGGSGSGDYPALSYTGNQIKFLTPYFTPDGSLTAYADFTVDATGNGAWNLVISHGCPGGGNEADSLAVTKDAAGSYDNTYTWDITKLVDQTEVETTPGGSVTLNYTVSVSHDGGTISNVKVTGTITVTNPNGADVALTSISDSLSDATLCSVDASGGLTVGSGDTEFPYSCDLSALPESQLDNTVTIAWAEQTLSDDSHLAAGSADFTFEDISFTENAIDECVDVTDSYAGVLGTVCVGDANPTTFNYSRTVSAPALGQCTTINNTATFTTNDTGATGSDSASAHICTFNAPLTIGYWKNHLNPISGACKSKDGCSANGPWTTPLLDDTICDGCLVGKLGNYTVDTQAKAKAVFDANNCSNAANKDADAAACLAAQLLAAKLNVANVANPCICSVIQDANAFLTAVGYNGPGSKVTFTSTYTRALAIQLKTALDNYNNGLGCPV